MNTDAPWPDLYQAESRVLDIQTKLHQWAADDPHRRFDDLHNLVADPAFLVVAWDRVRGNRGARSAGVDGVAPSSIVFGKDRFLTELRDDLKVRRFQPLPVRERIIPKPGSSVGRRLGIPTARDRTVQAALKLVLEPIFEADFKPASYGFRPKRRAQDAITEIHFYTTRSYEWVLEGDITACFDEISHVGLMDRLRKRIGDKRVLDLVKAFLKAGILSEDGVTRETDTGTPQGGILSPLLANVALSVLDEHYAEAWASFGKGSTRRYRNSKGMATYRLVRYADDFVVLVSGTRADAERLRDVTAVVLRPMGLRLSEAKTTIAHIDEGFDFLGFRIQRQCQQGSSKLIVYTWPSKKAFASVKAKVKMLTQGGTNQPLKVLLRGVNSVLRGWTNYFRHGASKETFRYLHQFAWRRILIWLRHKHSRTTWKWIRRHYLPKWWPTDGETELFDPARVAITCYRYRGEKIPTPWDAVTTKVA